MILALLKRYSSSDGSSCDVLIMNEAYVEPFVARSGLLIRSALEIWQGGNRMLSVGYYHCLIGM